LQMSSTCQNRLLTPNSCVQKEESRSQSGNTQVKKKKKGTLESLSEGGEVFCHIEKELSLLSWGQKSSLEEEKEPRMSEGWLNRKGEGSCR